MADSLIRLSPLFAGFALGITLRWVGILGLDQARTLLTLGYFVFIPAVAFSATSNVEITQHLLLFPAFAFIVVMAGYCVGRFFSRRSDIEGTKKTVFILACMIVNSAVALAFLSAIYGPSGAARAVLFDLVNAPLIYGLGYAIAVRGNPSPHPQASMMKKVLFSPPLWGLALGLIVNFANIQVPQAIDKTMQSFSLAFGPIITIAVGLTVVIKWQNFVPSVIATSVRLITGIIVATFVVLIFRLEGIDRVAVLVLGVAPVGFNTVTFASLENLDLEFAAETISISLLVGMIASSVVILTFA